MQKLATTTVHPHQHVLDHTHVAYDVMDSVLSSCTNYTMSTAFEIMSTILNTPRPNPTGMKPAPPCHDINELEVQDVFRIVCNVAKVREVTGKRLLGRPSVALGKLYNHSRPHDEIDHSFKPARR